MKRKQTILGLAAGATLLLAAGCGKPEPATTASGDTPSGKTRAAVEERADGAAAVATKGTAPSTTAAAAVAATPAVTAPASSTGPSNADTVANPTPKAGMDQATAATHPAATNLRSALQTQQLALAQTVTNQYHALALAASNQVVSAIGTNNLAILTGTNQVQALLERARLLTTNQQYQAALNTVTELYNTKLTPEQKLKVDELKNQIQAAIQQKATAEASSVLGNLLGGKKQ